MREIARRTPCRRRRGAGAARDPTRVERRVIGIRCRETQNGITATATLYVRAAGTPLPVSEVATEGAIRASVVFSKWNERVIVSAPSGAVTLS